MHAVLVQRNGGPDVLVHTDVDPPEPSAGEILVDVAAAGVNYIDIYHREGRYPVPTPFVLGVEGAGTVRAVGEGVDGITVGDHVAWKNALGSYAEQVVVPAAEAVPVPDGVDMELAAAVMLQGLTAHYLATSTYTVQPDDWVVVHAAAGGVGSLLTQVVKIRGGKVLATVSTPEKAEVARSVGADEISSYDEFVDRARELTGGEGVPCVYDGVGRTTFDSSLDALRIRGMMALYGAASGPVPPVDPQVLNAKGSLFLTRPTLGHYTRNRAELAERTTELMDWIATGRLNVLIGHRYALDQARQAHEDLQGRRTTGKLLLIPHN